MGKKTTTIDEKKTTIDEKKTKKQEFAVGTLVFISKTVEADLNGFCLFSQYKKDPYTVEAYDADRDVYTLRRQKLLVQLKTSDLVAPDANAHDSVNRMQY